MRCSPHIALAPTALAPTALALVSLAIALSLLAGLPATNGGVGRAVGSGDPVIVAAGDIASCGGSGDEATAALLDGVPGTVVALGDNAYPSGAPADYTGCYHPSWGASKDRTRPVPGNHDYDTPGAAGYFGYFGAAAGDPAQGYYSYDIGTWHVVALNSECAPVGGCEAGSPQETWLRADLAANQLDNILAYWHHPRYSSGFTHGSSTRVRDLYQALYEFGADVLLAGHEHNYERFAPQDADGRADPAWGIRQFVVGTGGGGHYDFCAAIANSEVRNADTFGVLKLTLHPDSYDWEFVPEAGRTFTDTGSSPTHAGTPPPTPTPTPDPSSTPTPTPGPACTPTPTPDPSPTPTPDPSATPTPTPTPAPDVLTFSPSDDTYIRADIPNGNFGAGASLQVDGSPLKNFLLKFSVSGVGARQVQSARLRLFAVDPSGSGGAFRRLANTTWTEGAVTWNNAPAADATLLASLGTVQAGVWYEVDVTPLVSGDGAVSLRVTSPSSNGADYSSKEGGGGLAPQLVVTVGP